MKTSNLRLFILTTVVCAGLVMADITPGAGRADGTSTDTDTDDASYAHQHRELSKMLTRERNRRKWAVNIVEPNIYGEQLRPPVDQRRVCST